LYEAARQRIKKGYYKKNLSASENEKKELLNEYIKRHELHLKNKRIKNID
jgi:hypothetical protein